MPEMDYSLIHRTPDGNGKILVTTPGSPDKGSWETEAELKTYVNQDAVMKTDIVQTLGQQTDKVPSNKAVDDAINAINTRVTNIEETLIGENEVTVQYPDDGNYSSLMPNKVPARALKFAEVPTIRGKSIEWNQLVQNGDFSDGTNNWGSDGVTGFSVSSGIASFTATVPSGYIRQPCSFINGHKYLAIARVKTTTATNKVLLYVSNGSGVAESVESTNWQTISHIFTQSGNADSFIRIVDNRTSDWDEIQVDYILCRDLTLIFGAGNEPSTVADALAQIPALCQYNPYDAGSLVDTVVSGAKSVGVNIWDEETKQGYYDSSGSYQSANNRLCTKNMIKVIPSTDYYVKLPLSQSLTDNFIICYDANGNFIERLSKTNSGSGFYFTTPANAFFINMNFSAYYTGGTTYNHNIQICLNSYADKTTYHPYKTDTLSLPEPVTLRGVGTCVETLDLETGVLDDGKFTLYDLGSISENFIFTGTYGTASNVFISYIEGKSVPSSSDKANAICTKYVVVTNHELYASDALCLSLIDYSTLLRLRINDPSFTRLSGESDADYVARFKAHLSGVYLLVEKATYTPSSPIDPITDNFLEVEGGGTVETIQTQTPVLDNCLDVTCDIIPQ